VKQAADGPVLAAEHAAQRWANAAAASAVHARLSQWAARMARGEGRFFVFRVPPTPGGGLGDRLRGLVAMFWAAYESDRILLIEWSSPRPLSETLRPVLYEWDHSGPYSGPCEYDIHLSTAPAPRWNHALNESRGRPERVVCAYTNMPFFGTVSEFRGVRKHVLRAIALQALFRPSDEVRDAADAMLRSAGVAPWRQPYTAIHFRHGGSEVGDQVISGLEDAHLFHRCAAALRPGLPLLLLSDSTQGRHAMDALQPKPALVEGDTVFHVDHVTRPDAARSGNILAFASLFLIARAACAVISNSGFSAIALLMGLNTTAGSACWAYACDSCELQKHADRDVADDLANPRRRKAVNRWDNPDDRPPPAMGVC
jgi:hypothetical protein